MDNSVRARNARAVAYYVTAHGYGHGVRSCDIIRAFNERYPQHPVILVSNLSPSFFSNRLGSGSYELRAGSFDVGMVQLDSIRVNIPQSLVKVLELYDRRDELVRQELEFLRSSSVGLVVSDIPGIPLESAALLGIPCLAVGNFSWDWIYSAYVEYDRRWADVAAIFEEEYSKADLLMRLPFSPGMSAFRRIEDLPLVASPGTCRRREIAALTGSDPGKKWILISFTTLQWSDDAVARVEKLSSYEFFTVLPLQWKSRNIHPLDRDRVPYSDVLASMDGVVTKPGYGILSDCIVNGKPLIYADRSDFMEYAVLEAAVKNYLKHVHIPADMLYRGELEGALADLWAQPEPRNTLPRGGAAIAAGRMRDFL